jgi:APA family basic amino acid/polyamine antiporter
MFGTGSWEHFQGGSSVAPSAWLLALIPVMFSYSGWNAAAYVAEEVRDPTRNVPLALALGTLAVIVLYFALNALYLFALPINELAAVGGGRLMDTVAERLFGFATGNLLAIFTIVSLAASISAMVLAGPRVYFAMARDGIFVRAAGRVHPRFHTPATAIIAQAVWSCVLVLSGTLSQLVNYTGFAVVLFAGIAVSAIFPLRRRRGGDTRPFSALGYPWAPAIFVIASALMVGNAFWREPVPTSVGAGLIALGIPVYFAFRSSRRS